MAPTSETAEAASTSLLERTQNLWSEHKQAIIIGGSIGVAATALYCYATMSSSGGPSGADSDKKKKKRTQKKKKGDDGSSPIIEEVATAVDEAIAASLGAETKSHKERMDLATELKLAGNKAYGERKFVDAVRYYTRAIEISPSPEPVFFSNRAASYMYYPVPEYEKAVEDCTEALRIDPAHQRSVGRRATALEKLGRYEEALRDFTAATLLSKFSDQKVAESVERVLKLVTEPKARELFANREPRLPPYNFVDAYFGAFKPPPEYIVPENASTGDHIFKLAADALAARDYAHAITFCNEALEQGLSTDATKGQALNLRGSFRFLMGDSQLAKEDFEAAIKALPSFTQSWVKIASVHMEQGKTDEAFAAFEEAIKQNPNDPDIYYHRGQVLFIMQNFGEAAENYSKSLELDSEFVFSHIQLAVAQYKSDQIAKSMATFRKTLKAFPQRSEPYNYYGELLLDQKRFEDAIEKFDRAIEIEKAKKPPINVLAMVNKGLTLFQWKNDITGSEAIIKEALDADPDCEAAVATLAQISLQRGEVERAMELFSKQVELARTESDMMNALQFMHAAKAQNEFSKNYPQIAEAYRTAEVQQREALAAAGAPAAWM